MKYKFMTEQISHKFLHLLINLCVKYVFNAQYQCVKCTNYEYIFFAQFPLLSHEMLNLWWRAQKNTPRDAIFIFLNVRKDIEGWLLNHEWSQGCKETWKGCSKTIYFGH
jgi:hypothetical protein